MRTYGKSTLRPPTVVASVPLASPIDRTLAPTILRPRRATSFLRGPVVVNGARSAQIGPASVLAASRRGKPRSTLRPPQVVNPFVPPGASPPVDVHLAYSRRGRSSSRLGDPQVVFDPVAYGGPSVRLVSPVNRRQLVGHELAPPQVLVTPFFARPVQVELTGSKRGRPLSRLAGPQVVFDPVQFGGPGVRLSSISSRRQIVQSTLTAPAVVSPFVPAAPATPVATRLTRVAFPRRSKARLGAPTVIAGAITYHGPGVKLAAPANRRAPVAHALRPPVVVATSTPFAPVDIHLAYSRRGKPVYHLYAPVVVAAGVANFGPRVRLVAPLNRRQPVTHQLFEPAVVIAAPPVVTTAVVRLARPKRPPLAIHQLFAPPAVTVVARVQPLAVRLTRSRRPTPTTSRLLEPAAVGGRIVYHGPGVRLAPPRSQRPAVHHTLAPPATLTPATTVVTIRSRLARIRPRITQHTLSPPQIIDGNDFLQYGPPVLLAPKPRATTRSLLRPPTVVTPVVPLARPLDVTLAASRRGKPLPQLAAPAVVAGPIVYHGPGVRLAGPVNRRQTVLARLGEPQVVTAAVVLYPTRIRLAPSHRGVTRYRLSAPAVVAPGVTNYGPRVRLVAPQNTRRPVAHDLAAPVVVTPVPPVTTQVKPTFARFAPGRARSILFEPAVVGGAIAFRGPGVRLVNPKTSRQIVLFRLSEPVVVTPIAPVVTQIKPTFAPSHRGRIHSTLARPTVVAGATTFHGPGIRLAAPRSTRPEVVAQLTPPTAVGAAALTQKSKVTLAPSRRGRPQSSLNAPAAVAGAAVFHGPGVRLVAPANARATVQHRLTPPTVVASLTAFHGPGVKLTAPINRRQKVQARLAPPAVVGAASLTRPAKITLAPARRGHAVSRLSPPTVVAGATAYHGPGVRLVSPLTTRRPVRHVLAPPTVLGVTYAFHGPGVRLAGPIDTRQPVTHRLQPPTIVEAAVAFGGPGVTLAPPRRGTTTSTLAAPTSVRNAHAFHGPRVRLVAPVNSRRPVEHFLRGPILVTPTQIAFFGTAAIARTPRTTTAPTLGAPTVVGNAHAFHGPRVRLVNPANARISYTHRLRPPAAVQAATLLFFGPQTHLAASRRGRPLSTLNTPAVVAGAVIYYGPRVLLTYSRRRETSSKLGAPISVSVFQAQPGNVTLARIRPARTHALLHGPTAVRFPPFRPLDITLARIRPVAVHSRLRPALLPPPTFAQATLAVTLAPSRRPKRFWKLEPPARVGAGIVHRPLQTHLVRITHPPVNRMLGAPTAIITVSPCHGYISDFPPYGGNIIDHSQIGGHVVDAPDAGGKIQDMSTSAGLVSDSAPGGGTIIDKQTGT